MAAPSRPMGRAAAQYFASVLRSTASFNGPTYAPIRKFGYVAAAKASPLLQRYQLRHFPAAAPACSHCSQQLYHHGSSSSPCASTHCTTSSQTPRRINRRTELDFEELRALQGTGDIALIDVRHPQELMNYGEIPGSVNIPLCQVKMALQLTDEEWAREFQFEKPTKGDRNIVFYARGPNASSAAVEIAHRLGFKLSRHYIGGWEEYSKQTGLPLKKPQDSFGTCGNAYQEQFDQYFL